MCQRPIFQAGFSRLIPDQATIPVGTASSATARPTPIAKKEDRTIAVPPNPARESRANKSAAVHSAIGTCTRRGCSGCPSHLPLSRSTIINVGAAKNRHGGCSCLQTRPGYFERFFFGRFFRFVLANSLSCFLLIDFAICLEAPLSFDFFISPRLAARAAPAAICCFFDFAGILGHRVRRGRCACPIWNCPSNKLAHLRRLRQVSGSL